MPRSWWHWKWSWMSRLKHSTVAPSRTPWLFHEWSPDIVRYLWGCRFCSYCQVGKAPLSSLDSFEKRPASKARFCRQQVFFYDVLAERSFSVKTPVTFENFAVGFSHSWGSEICKNYWSSHLVWFVRTYGVLRCLGFLHKSGSRNWKISHLLQKQKVFNGVSPLNFHRNEKLCSFFAPWFGAWREAPGALLTQKIQSRAVWTSKMTQAMVLANLSQNGWDVCYSKQKSHSSLISPPRHATKRPWASPSRKWRGKTPISGLAKRCQSGEKFIMDITRSKAYQKNTHLRTQGPKTHDYHRLPRGETWIKKISVIRGPAVQAAEHDVQVNKPTESSQKVIGVTVPASKSKSLNHCAMGIKAPRPKSKTRLIATKVSPQIQWHQISPLRKVGRTNAPFTNKFIFQFGVNPVRLSWVRTGKVPEIPVLPTAGSAP